MNTAPPTFLNNLLPKIVPCERLNLKEGEIIVHAPGFEDRTMDITQSIMPCSDSRAILFDYLPHKPTNKLTQVREELERLGVTIKDEDILKYNRFEPGNFESILEHRFKSHAINHVIIDISTMSKLLLILVLNACYKLNLKISIIYCEAKNYHPNQEKFKTSKLNGEIHQPTLQIYTGVQGVVRVKSLSSVAMQGQPTAAIVFMSFNNNLTQVLLNTVYPGRLFLINGRPPGHSWREEATAWIHDQVRQEWKEDNPVSIADKNSVAMPKRITSTLDYRETICLLLEMYWQLSTNHRILLAPSGSKMQAVGCFLLKALHPDVHIEYPSPVGFAEEYSEGIGNRWLLDFGNISERLEMISNAEREEYLEIRLNK